MLSPGGREERRTFSTGRRIVSAEMSWQSSSSSAMYRRLSPLGLTVQFGRALVEAPTGTTGAYSARFRWRRASDGRTATPPITPRA